MYWYQSIFFGMHFFWWVFWFLVIVSLFSWATPVSRRTVRLYREDPLSILQRRLAAGELTIEEYDARKARIERDLGPRSSSQFNRNAPA